MTGAKIKVFKTTHMRMLSGNFNHKKWVQTNLYATSLIQTELSYKMTGLVWIAYRAINISGSAPLKILQNFGRIMGSPMTRKTK